MGNKHWMYGWNAGPNKAWKDAKENNIIHEIGTLNNAPGIGCSWGHYILQN